jgi:autotransporter-associated beta strand protein
MVLGWKEVSVVVALISCAARDARSETWALSTGGSWNTAANWDSTTVPNGIGATATFFNAANGAIPAQSENRIISLDESVTVGSLTFRNDAANAFTNRLGPIGPTGSATLIFDAAGAGPATIDVPAAIGTGNNTLNAQMFLNDTLVATVDQITATSADGALDLVGPMTGAGGFTKRGPGLTTFRVFNKSYTGPTLIEGGRLRILGLVGPRNTSSITVAIGGQLFPDGDLNNFVVVPPPLNLNGYGPTFGPFAAFPGALRTDSNFSSAVWLPIVLQSNTLIHVQRTTNETSLRENITGPGWLELGAPNHDANLGQLSLNGDNSYSGGSIVHAGTLFATAFSSTAFGTGDVTVESAHAVFPNSVAKLSIAYDADNALADTAMLSLAGGNVPNVADDGYLELGSSGLFYVNETVRALRLAGVPQQPGTYGSTASLAMHKLNEFFAGSGMLTVLAPSAVAGDYNGNSVVDAADYVVWRKQKGLVGQFLAADGTGNGSVDDADYAYWRQRFGNTASPATGTNSESAAIPEPASVLSCLIGLLCVAFNMRRCAGGAPIA